MRVSTLQMFQQRVTTLLEQQATLNKTELQLATGQRMLSAAEDPAGALRKLQLGDHITQFQQYQKNADAAYSRLTLEEAALSESTNQLHRVRELAIQAGNASLSPEDLGTIAVEVRGILDSFLQSANSQDANGEYLFAGYQVDAPAFSHDGLGNFTYHGNQGQRLLQIGATRQIAVNDHGAGVFLGVPATAGGITSGFDILYDFAQALEAGVPLADTISDIDAAMDKLLTTRAEVGTRLRAVEDQRDTNEAFMLVMEKDRSALTDLDYAEATARFSRQLLAFQASQQVFAKIQNLSLFNYIT